MAVVRDVLESIHQRRGSANSGSDLFAVIDPTALTTDETAAVVTNYSYQPGDPRRYGAIGNGSADDSVGFQRAVNTGLVRLLRGTSYKILTPATRTGPIIILGEGPTSKLLCDATVLTVMSGTGSFVDNFWMENLTAPYIVTRNPNNWAAALTPAQSNGLGYQPTTNDPEYATWVAGQPLVGTQNIGPTITFTAAASDISVSRIYGRFVRINIFDAINSTIRDCDYQGGKGNYSAVLFDNCTNNIQQGQNNQAINNRIGYASQCGITFFNNVDFIMRANTCYNCGQSGVQTAQSGGIAFTASVGGATSGTLNAPWGGPTGTWQFGFSDGSARSGPLTNGSTAISWTGALAAGSILNAAVWGALGSPASNADPRCGRGSISDNRTYNNYYDGVDCISTFGITNDATQSQHQIQGNYTFRNRLNGINTDGQYNSIVGNHIFFNGQYGIWGTISLSEVVGNFLIDNNQLRNGGGGIAEILAVGAIAHSKIADNYIWGGASQNCPGILVTASAVNYISDNIGVGTTTNSFGAAGGIASVIEANLDTTTGDSTSQCFIFYIQNNAGTIQHSIIADTANSTLNLACSRIKNASASFTTTPTGADNATAMAAGAKISSANTNQVIFDTAAQYNLNGFLQAVVARNSSGTAVNVVAFVASVNVNGITLTRLFFQFANATTDAAFALTAANIAAGKYIQVSFLGKLS